MQSKYAYCLLQLNDVRVIHVKLLYWIYFLTLILFCSSGCQVSNII